MPTLERLVILINRYKENQEKLWIKGKPPVVENGSNIDLYYLKNIQVAMEAILYLNPST